MTDMDRRTAVLLALFAPFAAGAGGRAETPKSPARNNARYRSR